MRKGVFGRSFSRDTSSRQALFRSLTKSLIERGKVVTTKQKAKAIQGSVDKLITLLKKGGVARNRSVLGQLGNDRRTVEILNSILPSFSTRTSGYTRATPLPRRLGDMAQMVRLEFVDPVVYKGKEKPVKATKEVVRKDSPKTKKGKSK